MTESLIYIHVSFIAGRLAERFIIFSVTETVSSRRCRQGLAVGCDCSHHNRLAVVAAIFGSNGIPQRQLPTLQSKWTIPHPQCQHEPMDTPSTAQLARSPMVVPVLHVDLMSAPARQKRHRNVEGSSTHLRTTYDPKTAQRNKKANRGICGGLSQI
jgi:hypothetical protein